MFFFLVKIPHRFQTKQRQHSYFFSGADGFQAGAGPGEPEDGEGGRGGRIGGGAGGGVPEGGF